MRKVTELGYSDDLTKVARPSPDNTNVVSDSMGQWGSGSVGQDEDVVLPNQKCPSLAFKLEKCIGEPD